MAINGSCLGSCLCGDVKLTIDGARTMMGHCHCSMCRKAHGAPFATYLGVPQGTLRLEGTSGIARYAASEGAERAFCRRCGSVVPGPPAGGLDFLPAGLLDDDPGIRPDHHLFVDSKQAWYEITDDLPRHAEYPSGWGSAVPFERRTEPAAGKVRGSCLCGGVAYEVDGEIEGPIIYCHCGRCRKARAAAHAANCFVALDRFRWLRGEELVASYKVPEARVFAHAFCTVCGGGVARVSPERGVAVIPTGSLDDDPGARPGLHIWVGSKAPWDVIRDSLPQYEEAPPGNYLPASTQR